MKFCGQCGNYNGKGGCLLLNLPCKDARGEAGECGPNAKLFSKEKKAATAKPAKKAPKKKPAVKKPAAKKKVVKKK